MKNTKEAEMLADINNILLMLDISHEEREILTTAKSQLLKNDYFPKILITLENRLSPLAAKSKLSLPVGEFYLKTTGRHFKNKGPAGGIINALQNRFV